jgi:hypothetical protein
LPPFSPGSALAVLRMGEVMPRRPFREYTP